MNPQPFTFTDRPVVEDWLAIGRIHLRVMVRGWLRFLICLTSIFFLCLALALWWLDGFTMGMMPLVGIVLYFPWGWWFRKRQLTRRQYQTYEATLSATTVMITEESIYIGDDMTEQRADLGLLSSVADSPQGLLFMRERREAWFYLPDRVFADAGQKKSLLDFLRGRGVHVMEVG